MEKQIINLTSRFLHLDRLVLFLLIAVPISIRVYSPANDSFVLLSRLIAGVGWTCWLCWLFAIGHRANEKLALQAIHLNVFRYFNGIFIVIVGSFLLLLFFSTDVNKTINGVNVHYVTPIVLPVVFLLAFIAAIVITAKTLVSAELKKNASIGEYFTTVLLMVFAAIGLWFIQPRVQKL